MQRDSMRAKVEQSMPVRCYDCCILFCHGRHGCVAWCWLHDGWVLASRGNVERNSMAERMPEDMRKKMREDMPDRMLYQHHNMPRFSMQPHQHFVGRSKLIGQNGLSGFVWTCVDAACLLPQSHLKMMNPLMRNWCCALELGPPVWRACTSKIHWVGFQSFLNCSQMKRGSVKGAWPPRWLVANLDLFENSKTVCKQRLPIWYHPWNTTERSFGKPYVCHGLGGPLLTLPELPMTAMWP